MAPTTTPREGTGPASGRVRQLLGIAAFFGLLCGTGEAAGQFVFIGLTKVTGVGPDIAWIAPIFNLLAFLLGGLLLVLLGRAAPRLCDPRVFVAVFGLITLLDWLGLGFKRTIHPASLILLGIGLTAALLRWYRKRPALAARIGRRGTVALTVTTAASLLGFTAGSSVLERVEIGRLPQTAPSSPDVLIIVMDALRADHLSAYGYDRPTSPTIDRFAREGVLFENAVAASSYSLPSHASLLTGLYPGQHEVVWLEYARYRNPSLPKLPVLMRERGYRTAAFSGNTFWFTREHGFGIGFVHFEDYFHSVLDMAERTVLGTTLTEVVLGPRGLLKDIPARKRASDTNRSLLRWIDRSGDAPFFIVVNYFDTHDPYIAPEPFRSRFSPDAVAGGRINWQWGRDGKQLTPGEVQSEIAGYDGTIAWTDEQLRQLLDGLRQRGRLDDLLLVITSDHGEAFGEHDAFLHGNSLYREEIHVPLVVWGPGRVPAGLRIARPVSNAWIAATIADLAGPTAEDARLPGISLRPLWEAPSEWADSTSPLAELEHLPWVDPARPVSRGALRSITAPRWHLISHATDGLQLFDWQADPLERRDLATDPSMAAQLARLKHVLDSLPGSIRAPAREDDVVAPASKPGR